MHEHCAPRELRRGTRLLLAAIIAILSLMRLAHVHLLWADEDYHLAAALQMLHGRIPYHDFWYDKPPLTALYYALIGAHAGVALRLLDAAYILAACAVAYRFAARRWGSIEGWVAALLFAFYTTFYLPSAVIPFAADALMLVPHLCSIYCASQRRSFLAGCWAGVALLANTKAAFVLAACALWMTIGDWVLLAAGFVCILAPAAAIAFACNALPGYIQQVWQWSLLYARLSPVTHPWRVGLSRTIDWLGFHAGLAIASAYGFRLSGRAERWRFASWMALSFVAACLGARFAPHYFLQLLPPLVLLASYGVARAWRARQKLALALLVLAAVVPVVRFGPRYVTLAFAGLRGRSPDWRDVAMDLDSRAAARFVTEHALSSDTLFVWGYRPDVYVYTRLVPDSLFWDSQPLTGVPADRHLSATGAIYAAPAVQNRRELATSHPVWIVDGLSLLNPRLRPDLYPELRDWFAHYRLIHRTNLSLIYRRED